MAHSFGWTEAQIPVVGQGTWMIEKDPRPHAIEALRLGVELGMTLIDTAEMYGAGRAEEIVGEAIRGRREELFIVSKVLPSNASYDGTRRACERSLKRLGIERLDLYLLHWPGSHPISDTMRGLESLVDQRDGSLYRRQQLRYRRAKSGRTRAAEPATGVQSGPVQPRESWH